MPVASNSARYVNLETAGRKRTEKRSSRRRWNIARTSLNRELNKQEFNEAPIVVRVRAPYESRMRARLPPFDFSPAFSQPAESTLKNARRTRTRTRVLF